MTIFKMDKLILKKIAKRWCKGVLYGSEAGLSFGDNLTEEECNFIQMEIEKIADRITSERAAGTVPDLIAEYYNSASGQTGT